MPQLTIGIVHATLWMREMTIKTLRIPIWMVIKNDRIINIVLDTDI